MLLTVEERVRDGVLGQRLVAQHVECDAVGGSAVELVELFESLVAPVRHLGDEGGGHLGM